MLGKHYYLNMCGSHLNELEMRNIPRPRLELTTHVTTKTVQAGAFLGTLVVGPLMAVAKGDGNKDGIKAWQTSAGLKGAAIGLIAGPLLTFARLQANDISTASVWDRCYRIRYNKKQMRVDRLSIVGAIAGVAAASYLGESAALGALLGLNTGMVLAFVCNSTIGV